MFVRIEREKAIHRTTTGPKKALFQKELMWNKRERKQQQIQQQRELEEEKRNEKRRVKLEQRDVLNASSGKKKKSPSKIKDRFAQQRQIGFEVTAADQDGFEASRWVQPATTQNAGPLAPWACSNPEATEKGYDTQTFPLWDVETVKALTPEPHRHLANRNNLTGLYHVSNNSSISKLNLLKLFKKHMAKDINISSVDGIETNKSFIDTRKLLNYKIPSYDLMISEMSELVRSNESLYRHYESK